MELLTLKSEILITVRHVASKKMSKRIEDGLLAVAQNE